MKTLTIKVATIKDLLEFLWSLNTKEGGQIARAVEHDIAENFRLPTGETQEVEK